MTVVSTPHSVDPVGRIGSELSWWALIALVMANCVYLGHQLTVSDLIWNYPFMRGDAHDWIANGLYLAGEDVRYSGRPPLVPPSSPFYTRTRSLTSSPPSCSFWSIPQSLDSTAC